MKTKRLQTRNLLLGVAALLLILAGWLAFSRPSARKAIDKQYVAEIQKWHQERLEHLKSESGWLNLAGLYWLEEGENTFGADSSNDLVFPAKKAPAHIGSFLLRHGEVTVKINPQVTVLHSGKPVKMMKLENDQSGHPTILSYGSLRWFIIKRSEKIGVRLRDLKSPAIAAFKGIDMFPIDPTWRVEAKLEPYSPPKKIPIPTIIGTILEQPSPGALVFEIGGKTYRLDPVAEPQDKELFLIFADKTTGKETYGGGRFLYVPRPDKNGKTYIDFNKAYNPPCAFTPYATCPLPPAQNKLPIAVKAGEKNYAGHGH